MNQIQIFYPLFAMVALPAMIVMRIVYVRLRAIQRGEIEFHYIEKEMPAPMSVTTSTHNLANLFEFPVIFIAAIIIIMMFKHADIVFVSLAWAYVMTRYLHSIVHITSNTPLIRFSCFAASNLILIAIWVRMLILFTELNLI